MRILGIDPGLKIIRLNPKTSLVARLAELAEELEAVFDEYKPQVCAVEKLYSHYKHAPTAVLMAHARGVILLTAQRRGVLIEQFAANRIKQSVVGAGHASKVQMQRAIQSLWNLKEPPDPPDVADALAVALCCGRHIAERTVFAGARTARL